MWLSQVLLAFLSLSLIECAMVTVDEEYVVQCHRLRLAAENDANEAEANLKEATIAKMPKVEPTSLQPSFSTEFKTYTLRFNNQMVTSTVANVVPAK